MDTNNGAGAGGGLQALSDRGRTNTALPAAAWKHTGILMMTKGLAGSTWQSLEKPFVVSGRMVRDALIGKKEGWGLFAL